MTDKEKAVVMAYTGIAMLIGDKFDIFHKYVEEIMCRPVFTHELAFCAEEIKEKSKPDFLKLCDEEGQERPQGEWIDWGLMAEGHSHHAFNCSECDSPICRLPSELPNFCEVCGSDNRKSGKQIEALKTETKKCPICGSDLYEYCFSCCYEGEKVRKNET